MALNILLSAYACAPGMGSEPGVGWRWVRELARLGHRVTVLTRADYQGVIEAGRAQHPELAEVRFVYHRAPAWVERRFIPGRRHVFLHYLAWQHSLLASARPLIETQDYDLAHHLTYGVVRHPSRLGELGLPLVFGPVGGAERAPWRLRRGFSQRGHIQEFLRDAANHLELINPYLHRCLAASQLILCKTPETLNFLPARYRAKAVVQLEIGTESCSGHDLPPRDRRRRLLFVGRLIDWKGAHLALMALQRIRAQRPDVELTLIGKGPNGARLQTLASRLGLADAVHWIGWMEREQLLAAYADFDLFLFPSLHDSSGNVVLEAMANALPVVCLDLGGPGTMVDDSCGRVVSSAGRSPADVAGELAAASLELLDDPQCHARCSHGARLRAARSTWPETVRRSYTLIGDRLGLPAATPATNQRR